MRVGDTVGDDAVYGNKKGLRNHLKPLILLVVGDARIERAAFGSGDHIVGSNAILPYCL